MNRSSDEFEFDSQSTADLISAARQGCRDAQSQLFVQLQSYLNWVADRQLEAGLRRKLGPSDAVQLSMLRTAERFGDFRGSTPEQLHAWIREILINEVKQIRRTYAAGKRDVHREQFLWEGSNHRAGDRDPADSLPTPGAQAIESEQAQWVHQAINRLPDDYREVIQLRNWDRLSFQEIAQRMNRSENAVTKLWFRALVRLEQELEANDDG